MYPTHRSEAGRSTGPVASREDFTYKAWMAAAALVTAVTTAFLALAFLSPEVNIELPRGQIGAGANGD